MEKPVYTEAIHAGRLVEMLEKAEVCLSCPAAPRFSSQENATKMWNVDRDVDDSCVVIKNDKHPCVICRRFVGLPLSTFRCPCHYFGSPNWVVEVTWIALEEKGYI
jgi:hypothetical protein